MRLLRRFDDPLTRKIQSHAPQYVHPGDVRAQAKRLIRLLYLVRGNCFTSPGLLRLMLTLLFLSVGGGTRDTV